MDSARALVAKGRGIALVSRTMGVSRAQLSLRINRSADWQDRRCNRRNDEADAEILSDILDIISDMPSYGYRRVWGILRKQRRTEGQPPVNAKRLYRIMSEPCVVRRLRFSGPKTSIICSPMTSLKTSIKLSGDSGGQSKNSTMHLSGPSVRDMLIRYAEENDVDLIIMGSTAIPDCGDS